MAFSLAEKQAAWAAFCEADRAWQVELNRVFGKDAGTARYQRRGNGERGTELRRLYDVLLGKRAITEALGHPARHAA